MGRRQYRSQTEWSAPMKQQASRSMPGENLLQGLTSRFSGIRGQVALPGFQPVAILEAAVKTHLSNIFRKLGVSDHVGLVLPLKRN